MPFKHSKLLLQAAFMAFSVPLQIGVVGMVSQKELAAQPTLTPAGAVPVTLQDVPQVVPLAHAKLLAQAAGEPAVHVPVPLHEPGVSELPVHTPGQVVPDVVS